MKFLIAATQTKSAAELPLSGSNAMRLAAIGMALGLLGLLLLLLSAVRRRLSDSDQI